MGDDLEGGLVTRWGAAGAGDVKRIEAADWREWPPELSLFDDRDEAVRVAREKLVPEEGAGHVLRVQARDGEPTGVIVEEADWRGPVPDSEFAEGPELPKAWRSYLQSPSWLRRGWLSSGKYVWLYPPVEARQLLAIWETEGTHPGIALIGGDGGLENFVLDLRQDPAPVLLVSNASESWDDAVVQAADIEAFIARIEDGTFDLTWNA
ncbi:hypothetical protein M1L60_39360 [Actinoplanes sp. TRM 88003]|uniref:Knr4/Smi1-like domain-containing protein n=1 Tax=Paractinoplanes aksuensis TaxID=2939490 RepID=A0ABT1E3G3_9ACTN|nr:hypothetical protein [Actinoplanes aksuensis]MCO8276655.1 hypothetical protein [Actinoplanes aksuensis]